MNSLRRWKGQSILYSRKTIATEYCEEAIRKMDLWDLGKDAVGKVQTGDGGPTKGGRRGDRMIWEFLELCYAVNPRCVGRSKGKSRGPLVVPKHRVATHIPRGVGTS